MKIFFSNLLSPLSVQMFVGIVVRFRFEQIVFQIK